MMNTDLWTWEYALFSANVHHYLPQIAWGAHPELYRRWCSYHQSAAPSPSVSERTGWGRHMPAGVLVLFHLGNHVEVPLWLARQGLAFDMIVDRAVYEKAQPTFDRMREDLQGRAHPYAFYMSDDPYLLLRCRSNFRSGRHILVFADAASGTPSGTGDRRVAVPFLAGHLHLKAGIPTLAALFGVPIVSLRPDPREPGRLRADDPIGLRKGESRAQFVQRALCTLCHRLGDTVARSPWMWECWPYLMDNGLLAPDPKWVARPIGQESIVSVKHQGRIWRFDRNRYCVQYAPALDTR